MAKKKASGTKKKAQGQGQESLADITFEDMDPTPPGDSPFVKEIGVYNCIVKEAWDSRLAPEEARDHGRTPYIGLTLEVIDGPQEANLIGFKLWVNSKENIEKLYWVVNEIFNATIDTSVSAIAPLSVGDLVGRHCRAEVRGFTDSGYQDTAPWDLKKPLPDHKDDDLLMLTADNENLETEKHYERVIARSKNKKDGGTEGMGDDELDDLPF